MTDDAREEGKLVSVRTLQPTEETEMRSGLTSLRTAVTIFAVALIAGACKSGPPLEPDTCTWDLGDGLEVTVTEAPGVSLPPCPDEGEPLEWDTASDETLDYFPR